MEFGCLGPGRLLDVRPAFLDEGSGQAIKAGQFANGLSSDAFRVAVVLPAPQNHAELGAPVAEMIVADDLVAEEAQRPGQSIADNSTAQVANVHRLGDVGRTVVNDVSAGREAGVAPQALVGRHLRPLHRQPVLAQSR